MKNLLFNSHSHSRNSPDGRYSVLELCRFAKENGLFGFAVTDHCECNRYFEDGYDLSVRRSVAEIQAAQKTLPDGLLLTAGIELGQPMQNIEAAESVLKAHDFDFVLMSVHQAEGDVDFYDYDKSPKPLDEMMKNYYDELLESVKWGQFDSAAHIEYPLRYLEGRFGISYDMKKVEPQVLEILKTLAQNGKGLEINVSGLRQRYGKMMPGIRYLDLFKEMGGEIVTIGTDAHQGGKAMAEGLREGMALAKAAGFSRYCYFQKRKPVFIKIEN